MKKSLKPVLLLVSGLGVAALVGFWFMFSFVPTLMGTNHIKRLRVQADIRALRTMLLSYNKTNGYYPSTDQGLQALVPRLMEWLPEDAWGTPYAYRYPGKRYPNKYDLFSAGPDRLPDTSDDEWGK